jgi:hypothetical protein
MYIIIGRIFLFTLFPHFIISVYIHILIICIPINLS